MKWLEISVPLNRLVRTGRIEDAVRQLGWVFNSLGDNPFQIVTSLEFECYDAFSDNVNQFSQDNPDIEVVYAEMNGFSWNYEKWDFSIFGFNKYGGDADSDWLSNWDVEYPAFPLKGMKNLQEVYAKNVGSDEFRDAEELCNLMVILKFQLFIQRAMNDAKSVGFVTLASAHDFDEILLARIEPSSNTRLRGSPAQRSGS